MEQPNQAGDWLRISILGSGSFGTVSLWRHQTTSESIAIKQCKFHRRGALSAKQQERWRMEVAFLHSIAHPNIIACRVLDPVLEEVLGRHNPTGLPLLPMEYCTKGNLRRFLSGEPIRLCGLAEQEVRDILQDVSSGLSHLHSCQITHRDIKPDNVVLQDCPQRRGQTLYKIIDLGYAKELNDATLSFVGTLHYLAPEIFSGHDYDRRVDYWSIGVMVGEIVSGVLPFLPEATPFERYERIKDKGPDDICIYTSYSGAVTNSTELKREHFISGCLKQNLETWLRRALQIDPANRRFSGDLSAFDFLRYILDKPIVQVFSLHKFEFYSYEVSDSTRLDTLKAWVARDIKIPVAELLFLDSHGILPGAQDDSLLGGPLSQPDVLLFAYKRDAPLSGSPPCLKVPNLVKELFGVELPFQAKFTRPLYRQALFLVHGILDTQRALQRAHAALVQHLEARLQALCSSYKQQAAQLARLSADIQGFLLRKKQLPLGERGLDWAAHPELGACLTKVAHHIQSLESRQASLERVDGQRKRLLAMQPGLGDADKHVRAILLRHDVQTLYDDINGKGFLERAQPDALSRIRGVISNALKLQCRLNQHQQLKQYSQDFGLLLHWTDQLGTWLERFGANVLQLGADFAATQQRHDALVETVLRPAHAQDIIHENALLRSQFADLLEAKIATHLDPWN